MQPHDRIEAYVATVCEQIRWKKAHLRIAEEMENHIIDQRDALIEQGLDDEAALDTAIANTGDAAEIGMQLDRAHRPKPQWAMLGATAALLMLGLIIKLFVVNNGEGISFQVLFWRGVGITGMLIAYFADFTLLGKYPKTVYFGVLALSVAALLFLPVVNGASYYTKYITLLFPPAFSAVVFTMRNKGYLGIVLCSLALALQGGIALLIPSISGFLHFAAVGAVLLVAAICKKWFGVKRLNSFLLMLVPVAVLTIVFLLNMTPRMWMRLAVALNPHTDPKNMGYMGVMTRELLSGATMLGSGTRTILTEDLLLTTTISFWGWISFAVILCALIFFMIAGFTRCLKQKSGLGFFVSLAIIMTLTVQAVSYILYNLGVQFAAPISLPLISHGNTAIVINLVLIGFMLSVFRTGDAVADGKAPNISYNSLSK